MLEANGFNVVIKLCKYIEQCVYNRCGEATQTPVTSLPNLWRGYMLPTGVA